MGNTCAAKRESQKTPTCTVAFVCDDDKDQQLVTVDPASKGDLEEEKLDRRDSRDFGFAKLGERGEHALREPLLAAQEDQTYWIPQSPEPDQADFGRPRSRQSASPRILDDMPLDDSIDRRCVRATHGEPSEASGARADEFDLCFRFVLPGCGDLIEADAKKETRPRIAEELRKLAEEDKKDLKEQNATFVAKLSARMKQRELWRYYKQCHDPSYVHQPFVEKLFSDFFVENADAERFVCPEIKDISDARKLSIDLILSMVRGSKQKYYSYVFSSQDRTELLVCLKIDREDAKHHAEKSAYPVQLDMKAVQNPSQMNIGVSLGREGEDSPSMQAAFVPFKLEMGDFFKELKEIDTIRLVYDTITDVLDIEAMKKWGLLVDFFPLHAPEKMRELNASWGRPSKWWSYHQPIDEIRDYFGENIAMYFVFVEFVCRWTRVLAVAGVFLTIVDLLVGGRVELSKTGILSVLGAKNGLPLGRIVFALFLVAWCLLFSIFLSRKCWRCYSTWGMDLHSFSHSSVKAEYNPRFAKSARMIKSEIDTQMIVLEVPYKERTVGKVWSIIGSIMFVLVASTALVAMIKFQAFFAASGNLSAANVVSYCLIIPIKVFNLLSMYACPRLADYEHHRDRLDYDNAIAYKMFYVQFINTFCTFYYIAFFMKPWGDTTYERFGGTWLYLTYEMCITFSIYLVFVVYDIFEPMSDLANSMRKEHDHLKRRGLIGVKSDKSWCSCCRRLFANCCGCCNFTLLQLPFLELQARMDPYTGETRNEDHMQIILPLGFVILFGATLPLSAGLALACFGLQLRVDAWKLTKAMRRPFPSTLEPGHWIWLDLVQHLMWIAIVTNIGLICFAMDPCHHWRFASQSLLFFVLCLAAVVVSTIIKEWVPEIPADVVLAQKRHRRQRDVFQHTYSEWQAKHKAKTPGRVHNFNGRCDLDFSNITVCQLEENANFTVMGRRPSNEEARPGA